MSALSAAELRKVDNECCRSSLQDAIRAIRVAYEYWPDESMADLVHRLQALKVEIKGELTPEEAKIV